uniref:Uncharacterized protein n=1 Tax=Podoviridae sp. ctn7K25 TaxID=2825273 RepID=A0A8S5QDU9_9CAUD|nr:MAG TPA: hypothetical protein [Podoviridae sp. ctn7K25]
MYKPLVAVCGAMQVQLPLMEREKCLCGPTGCRSRSSIQYEGVLRLHYRALWLQQDCLKGL